MGLTGKYDFKGIKKSGAVGLRAALALSPYSAWVLKIPGIGFLLEGFANWLANSGLVVLNIGAFYVNGELDTRALDRALNDGIDRVDRGGLTEQQKKEIDDAVIAAANRALPYGSKP